MCLNRNMEGVHGPSAIPLPIRSERRIAARTAAGDGLLPPQPQVDAGAVLGVGGAFLAFGLETDGEARSGPNSERVPRR